LGGQEVWDDHAKCVTLDNESSSSVGHAGMYCFDLTAPILRIEESAQGATQISYNGVASVQGAYVARDAIFYRLGNAVVRVHLDSLDAKPQLDEGLFSPPVDAMQVPLRSSAIGVSEGKVIHKVSPDYPEAAKIAGVQGTVTVQVIIGKDGGINDLRVISGPLSLHEAALQCVRQWRYEPFLLNGEPVQVFTDVTVMFSLGANASAK
jgi:TonB family protein